MSDGKEIFDFIVSGAGSAGAVVAARLSESGRHRVLLLEAGPPDTNAWIHIPLGFAKTYVDARVNWKFESAPQNSIQQSADLCAAWQNARWHLVHQWHGLHAWPPAGLQ
jgi:choline dehydrogenase-like flavoprotein